jgi:hypothetical protein
MAAAMLDDAQHKFASLATCAGPSESLQGILFAITAMFVDAFPTRCPNGIEQTIGSIPTLELTGGLLNNLCNVLLCGAADAKAHCG